MTVQIRMRLETMIRMSSIVPTLKAWRRESGLPMTRKRQMIRLPCWRIKINF
jgi:hypothetical protein